MDKVPPLPLSLPQYGPKEAPWYFSEPLFGRLGQILAQGGYKKVAVEKEDPEWAFVATYLNHHPPENRSIGKIWAIHKPQDTKVFELHLNAQQLTAQSPHFKPAWSQKQNDPLLAFRKEVFLRWESVIKQFAGFRVPELGSRALPIDMVGILPLWHGTSRQKCESICQTGFHTFGSHFGSATERQNTDDGYFGKGFYFTNSAQYAAKLYAIDGNLLLAWVSMRHPYPVVSDGKELGADRCCTDMNTLRGKMNYENYNAHYIPIAFPKCHPCLMGQQPDCDEVVVFNPSQILVSFWVELVVDLPESPSSVHHALPPPPHQPPALANTLLKKGEAEGELALRSLVNLQLPQVVKRWTEGVCSQILSEIDFRDLGDHRENYLEAALLGDVNAQLALGLWAATAEENLPVAIGWFEKAVEQGNVEAGLALSIFCYSKEPKKQCDLLASLAKRRDPRVTLMLSFALGLMNEEAEAAQALRIAATEGMKEAQFLLAATHIMAEGKAQDLEVASQWLEKSADQGLPDAEQLLIACYMTLSRRYWEGAEGSSDPGLSFYWCMRAADLGEANAQYLLGLFYQRGFGVPASQELSLQWLKKAANNGHPEAKNAVADSVPKEDCTIF
ncbi:MAG: hypothetical protein AB7M93_30570 [Candidatus Obscuribacterales bacterium]